MNRTVIVLLGCIGFLLVIGGGAYAYTQWKLTTAGVTTTEPIFEEQPQTQPIVTIQPFPVEQKCAAACPVPTPQPEGFCAEGTIILGQPDRCGCEGPLTCVSNETTGQYETLCTTNSGKWLVAYAECEFISEQVCTSNGGTYDSCGSSCRHDTEFGACNRMCVPVCSFAQ